MPKARRMGIIVILVGLIGITVISRNPRFNDFHTVDILQLVASGACFGIGATMLIRRA